MSCVSLAQGRVMRVTRLDGCGAPATGAGFDPDCAMVVSDGLVTVTATASTVAGTNIQQQNWQGRICTSVRTPDQFGRWELSINFCDVDPELLTMVTEAVPVTGVGGDVTGFDTIDNADADGKFYALEVWAGTGDQFCAPSGDRTYGYFLMPFVRAGLLSSDPIGNTAITFTAAGWTLSGGQWGTGVYDVEDDGASGCGRLVSAIGTGVHSRYFSTTCPPPTAACGCSAIPT